jgi:peroxiredoxin Q/BCP
MKIGSKAPLFSLLDQAGELHKLSDSLGQWVLLYFYPKDDTPGCTIEACSFRDQWPKFKRLKIKVFGISADSPKSHDKFATKFNLPFTLLSDPEKKTIEKYGALREKSMFGKKYMGIHRMSVLINPEGKIAKIYEQVNPMTHVDEVLKDGKGLL